ncbi:prepilin peptidase [Methylobacterium sp. J-076]|uniref:prepilin peptidase n=1 Tax=Methylobacterium sp. J-076 TaxID=2836655 RepID=UPI001FBBF4F6|nr:prepilin peptidase [Methylobacterium sp. J-076]MCJ2011904.1 prepilin peptidase [Methylobacterium sp. J-076]
MSRSFFVPCLPPLAAMGVAGAAWLGHGPACVLLILTGLALVAAQIAWQDLATFTISDVALLSLGALGLAARLSEAALLGMPAPDALGFAILDGLLCGAAFLLVREGFYRWRGYDGLGFGDVKLAFAGGILVGTEGFAWTVLAASLGGIVAALWLRGRMTGPPESKKLPYGALLAPCLWLVWLLSAGLPQIQAPALTGIG